MYVVTCPVFSSRPEVRKVLYDASDRQVSKFVVGCHQHLLKMIYGLKFFLECRRYFKLLLEWKLRNAMDGSVLHIAISIGEALKVLNTAINNKGIVRDMVLSVTTAHGNMNLMIGVIHYLSCLIEASIVFEIATWLYPHRQMVPQLLY